MLDRLGWYSLRIVYKHMPHPRMRLNDLTGQTFNYLTAVGIKGINKHRMTVWKWNCVCGKEVELTRNAVLSGNTKSCGCMWEAAHTTHGHTRREPFGISASSTYQAWRSMKHRCTKPTSQEWEHYGGRGIGYDPRWESFQAFLEDMGVKPHGLTLERVDNSQGYSKANCKWAPNSEQQQNKRNNRNLTYKGETLCLSEWARRKGMSKAALGQRLRAGWSLKEALETPIAKYHVVK